MQHVLSTGGPGGSRPPIRTRAHRNMLRYSPKMRRLQISGLTQTLACTGTPGRREEGRKKSLKRLGNCRDFGYLSAKAAGADRRSRPQGRIPAKVS